MKKKTVYIPTNKGNLLLIEEIWNKTDVHFNLEEKQLYTFTEEELNQYTESVIKKALQIAAESTCIKIFNKSRKAYFFEPGTKILERLNIEINKQSIINTFEEVYKNFKL